MSKRTILTTAALLTAALLQPSLARDPSQAPGDPGQPRHPPSQVPAPAAIPLPGHSPLLKASVPAPPPIHSPTTHDAQAPIDQDLDAVLGVDIPGATALDGISTLVSLPMMKANGANSNAN